MSEDDVMSSQATDALIPVQPVEYQRAAPRAVVAPRSGIGMLVRLALPTAAAALALVIHRQVPSHQTELPTRHYPLVLYALLGLSPLLTIVQLISARAQRWAVDIAPIFAASILLLCVWDLI